MRTVSANQCGLSVEKDRFLLRQKPRCIKRGVQINAPRADNQADPFSSSCFLVLDRGSFAEASGFFEGVPSSCPEGRVLSGEVAGELEPAIGSFQINCIQPGRSLAFKYFWRQ